MSGDISLFDVSRHFYVSAQHPSPPDATPPKKTNTIKKKHRVHLALLHVKHANNNLHESPLTSLLIVNQEHVYRYERKKKKKANCFRHRKTVRRCQRFGQGGNLLPNLTLLFFQQWGNSHLAWLSNYKPTYKPHEDCLSWRVGVVGGEKKREKRRKKTFQRNENALSLS